MDIKKLEESINSTIKAIIGNEEINQKLQCNFYLKEIDFEQVNQNNFKDHQIILPEISNSKNYLLARAYGDLAAIYLKYHDSRIHQKNSLEIESNYQNLFDNFEKIRLIKNGSNNFKGIANNLSKILKNSFIKAQSDEILPFLILENEILQTKIKNIKNELNFELVKKIENLANNFENQDLFAKNAVDLIRFLDNSRKIDQNKNPEKIDEQKKKISPENLTNNEENIQNQTQSTIENDDFKMSDQNNQDEELNSVFSERELINENHSEYFDKNDSKIKFVDKYQIFTKEFDQEIRANDLIDKQNLENLRNQLDLKLEKLEKISKKLTAKLKRKLLAKKQFFCEFNKEEGILDRKKISRIIVNSEKTDNFLQISEDDFQNIILTILIDNSGSMRGMPITMAAMASEIIAKIFENFGIKTEILGFTTIDWRGGKSKKKWEEAGKPKNPGRLSDLRHIIYKNYYQNLRSSKNNLALMLKDGILKENIDGEALIWASKRLNKHSEKKKILLVISDGTPVDDSTNSTNDNDILNDHLHHTINLLEKHSKINISAIGIGHDVGDFYNNSITIKNVEELGDVMINKICDII